MNSEPVLLRARDYAESDIGSLEWKADHNADILSVSNGGMTIEWGPRKKQYSGRYPPAWVPASTHARLHSGTYRWDFVIDELAKRQIGIGFMLLWKAEVSGPQGSDSHFISPDWGFYGYLGASSSAWSYDPYTGDVVRNTASIEGGLPKFDRNGIVSVVLNTPRLAAGSAHFEVEGESSREISLPEGAVVLPAACLLKEGQRITLAHFTRTKLAHSIGS
jgi:hypothetical protein